MTEVNPYEPPENEDEPTTRPRKSPKQEVRQLITIIILVAITIPASISAFFATCLGTFMVLQASHPDHISKRDGNFQIAVVAGIFGAVAFGSLCLYVNIRAIMKKNLPKDGA